MSLAHIISQPIVARRGTPVMPLGQWPAENPRRGVSSPNSGRRKDGDPTLFGFVAALCEELGSHITSRDVARLCGISVRRASSYLSMLAAKGKIESTGVDINRTIGGRPMKVYRWKG